MNIVITFSQFRFPRFCKFIWRACKSVIHVSLLGKVGGIRLRVCDSWDSLERWWQKYGYATVTSNLKKLFYRKMQKISSDSILIPLLSIRLWKACLCQWLTCLWILSVSADTASSSLLENTPTTDPNYVPLILPRNLMKRSHSRHKKTERESIDNSSVPFKVSLLQSSL